jgi:carbon-monoxide dehydrogenase large subunit
MNLQNDPQSFALMKFGIGQPVRRTEDPMLVRGEGCYTDDIKLTGEAYAVMVRSRIAHGVIKGIDTTAARNMPGVLGVYTGADLAAYGTLKCIVPFNNRDGTPMKRPPRPALATDKVRFVGDPVAFVVADTVLHAKDAAEAVEVDIDALPAVVRPEEASRPGAPLIHDEAPGNVALDYHFGDSEKVAAAFDRAAHVTRPLSNSRVVVNAIEPRAAIGIHDPASGRFTLHAPSQGAFGMRGNMAEILKVEPKQVRILTGHVGGSFGMKSAPFPEYVCVLHAARALGRPVKWTDERSGSFVSDSHGRDHDLTAELALDADGTFLALRITNFGNMGGFLAQVAPMPSTLNTVKNVQSVYRTPLIEVSTKCMFTNTSHVSAYRGAGRPEGNYYMERLIDAAAAEMGIDRVELRRRNQIRPREIPIRLPPEAPAIAGILPGVLKHALEVADVKGFARRKRGAANAGRCAGLIGSFLEVTAPPSKKWAASASKPTVRSPSSPARSITAGGHAALSRRSRPTNSAFRLNASASRATATELLASGGTGGLKSIMHSGTAIVEASAKVIDQGSRSPHVLEAAVADIEFAQDGSWIAGTDRAIGIMELAEKLRPASICPRGTVHPRHPSRPRRPRRVHLS